MSGAYQTHSRHAYPKLRHVALPAGALVGVNVVLMYVVAATPLATLNNVLFSIPIVGLVVYGAALTVGDMIAERGLESGDMGTALLGTALLQGAYALFGGGVVGMLSPAARGVALGVALVVTLLMALGITAYVYARDKRFDHWSKWSLGAFVVGALLVLVGSFAPIVLVGGFLFIFLGFTLRLGYEIWYVRDSYDPNVPLVHALGIYVAFTGVFVHVLQIVVRMVADR